MVQNEVFDFRGDRDAVTMQLYWDRGQGSPVKVIHFFTEQKHRSLLLVFSRFAYQLDGKDTISQTVLYLPRFRNISFNSF